MVRRHGTPEPRPVEAETRAEGGGRTTAQGAAAGSESNHQESRAVLDEFFRLSPDLLCVVDSAGLFVRMSEAWETVMGYDPGELIGRPVLRLLHPEDVARTRAAWTVTGEAPRLHDLVNRFRCKDGSWRWLEWSGSHSSGFSYAAARDITDRKQAEDLLRESERLLQTVFDGITDPIYAKDRQGRYVLLNSSAVKLIGRPSADILGRDDRDLFPHDEARRLMARDDAMMESGTPLAYEEVLTLPSREGATYLAAAKGPLVDEAGRVTGVFGISRDITEQRRAEEALLASEQRFQELMDRMPAACSVKDSENRLIYVNRAFIRDFHAGDWLGKSARDVFPREQAAGFERTDRHVLETGEPTEVEQLVPVDGELRSFVTHKFRMQGQGAPLVGTISFDITERRREEENRLALERRLAEAQKLESLGVLAGGIAHDFNNLLQTIMGNASLASMESGGASNIQVYLEEIELAAQRAADLARQMLAYSGQAPFVVSPLDLNVLISQMGDALKATLPPAIALERQAGGELPRVAADAGQIRQVLMSLVMNAAEAIRDREGTIRIATGTVQTTRDRLPDGYVVSDGFDGQMFALLEVDDTGCGMDEETRTRMFEPFFTTKLAGRGLGMAGVLGIVRRHHGAISVESEPGRGTSVRVLLPAAAEK